MTSQIIKNCCYNDPLFNNIDIWYDKYIFFLTTLAVIYPEAPTIITKKKHYEIIQNMHLFFFPLKSFSDYFEKLMDKYPVSSYLDNKKSFMKWIWFINNKINVHLRKPIISYEDYYIKYYDSYKSNNTKQSVIYKYKKYIIFLFIVIILMLSSYYFYNK